MKTILILLLLLASCSSPVPQTQKTKVTAVAQERKEFQRVIPKDGWEPIFFESINERAKIANLTSLRFAALPENDLEVRIWHGFGVTVLEGFVLNRAAGQSSAKHLDGIHARLPKSEYQKKLQPPKAGWEACWQRLVDAGILTSEIQCNAGVNDGMSYVVEFYELSQYCVSALRHLSFSASYQVSLPRM